VLLLVLLLLRHLGQRLLVEKNRLQQAQNLVLGLLRLVETAEQKVLVVVSKQAVQVLHELLGKLRVLQQVPVAMLNFQETSQVICLVLHQANKGAIY
jgi:hypothetical protein